MKFQQATIKYLDEEKQINLPEEISELILIIEKEFQVQNFEIEIPLDDLSTIFFLMNESHKNEYEFLLKTKKIITKKLNIIKIQPESRQTIYYDTFIKEKSIECCNQLNCSLCNGQGYISLRDEDKYKIDKIIKNNLEKKFEILKKKFQQNNIQNLESIFDFLKYHQMVYQNSNKNLLDQKVLNYQKQTSISTKFNLQIKKEFQMKLLSDQRVSQKLDQDNNIIIHYQNNGKYDWPDQVYFFALDGPIYIKQKVKSLKQKEVVYQKISIPATSLNQGQYVINCILGYHVSRDMSYFGEIISINLNVISQNESIQVVISGFNEELNQESQDEQSFE